MEKKKIVIYGFILILFITPIVIFKENLRELRQELFISQTVSGNITGMRLFLLLGADVNACSSGNELSALGNAAFFSRTEPIKFLIDNGAKLDSSVCYDDSLQTATYFGHFETAKLLIERGIDVNYKSGTESSLTVASRAGHLEIAKLIINNGADLIQGGEQALKIAIISGNLEIVKLLIEKGVDTRKEYPEKGSSLLDYAESPMKKENKEEIIKVLKESGAKD